MSPQIMKGILISAAPGKPIGSAASIYHLVGIGSPVNSTDDSVVGAGVGSLYTDAVSGLLYVNQASGGWTSK
jgi:hypothetical protein